MRIISYALSAGLALWGAIMADMALAGAGNRAGTGSTGNTLTEVVWIGLSLMGLLSVLGLRISSNRSRQ